MLNNTEQHISSKAESVELDPSSTNFPSNTTDVQKMANLIQPHAIGTYESMKASTTKMGILRIATEAEVLAGMVTDATVTPATLQAKWIRPDASDTVKGLVRYATVAERAEASASVSIGMNTAGVWDIVRNKSLGTTTKNGSVKLSTTAIGQIGTDNTTVTTPLVVKAMIDTFAITTNPAAATETTNGVVKISPSPVINSALHVGVAVSPKGFIETRATQSRVGTVVMATQAQANARTATDVALSPATLPIASSSQYGITALLDVVQSGATNKALSAHGATNLLSKITGGAISAPISANGMWSNVAQSLDPNALTRKDYVDGADANLQTQINNRIVNGSLFKKTNRVLTQLFNYNGGLPNGNFSLNDRWDNYDGIIFEGSGDDQYGFVTKSFDKTELTLLQQRVNYFVFSTDGIYWMGKFGSDGRTFFTSSENSRLWRVYGYKDVYAQA
ncbi:gp12 short tail fibers [Aeromonas phage 65]|uniref:Gp12 short tail fibers n=1 Tax=Aeromonas phage 65 TaxID=2919549 RepID=E5DRT2_9CAUD|nr:tail collar fiber protein [Aeromonas phage 65]ADQ53106.1 gp12 short tail fibers [Aeromonas phage 65]